MSSIDSIQVQSTSICSVPSALPNSVSVLTRCPDPAAHGTCRPPTVTDPDIPGATWVLCHTWVQVMPATTSVGSQIHDDADTFGELVASVDQKTVKDQHRKGTASSDTLDATPCLESKTPATPVQSVLSASRTVDTANVIPSAQILKDPTKGTAPIERDYATRSQCPASEQWKKVYEALEKTQPAQAPLSQSNCSRMSKVTPKPSTSRHVASIQAANYKAPPHKAASVVISDESSDCDDVESVHTDTTDEQSGNGSKGKQREILASESVSHSNSPLAWDVLGGQLGPADSKVVKDKNRNGRDTQSDIGKTGFNYANSLGLHPHATLGEAKEAYIERSGDLLERMQDMRTDDRDLDDLLEQLKGLRLAYRLQYLTQPAQGFQDGGYEGDGDTSDSVSPKGLTIVRDEWTRSERPTPHPKKYASPAPKPSSKTRFA